jgi:hypothetical protein
MNRYRLALRVGTIGFASMLLLVFALSALAIAPDPGTDAYISMQLTGVALSLIVVGNGLFLWISGFRRFKSIIGPYGVAWLSYVTFTILSGFYMEYRYGEEQGDS